MPCTQPLLIHQDGRATCSIARCLDGHSVAEAVREHRHVVNCRSALGTKCPVCHPMRTSRPKAGACARDTASDCLGVVIVHADLSVECSKPDCPMDPSRAAWSAKHRDIRSCGFLPDSCPCAWCPTCPALASGRTR
jgi:hypothetical protein